MTPRVRTPRASNALGWPATTSTPASSWRVGPTMSSPRSKTDFPSEHRRVTDATAEPAKNRSETHAHTRHRAASEPSAVTPEYQWHDSARAAYAKRSPAPSEWVERVEQLTWGRADMRRTGPPRARAHTARRSRMRRPARRAVGVPPAPRERGPGVVQPIGLWHSGTFCADHARLDDPQAEQRDQREPHRWRAVRRLGLHILDGLLTTGAPSITWA